MPDAIAPGADEVEAVSQCGAVSGDAVLDVAVSRMSVIDFGLFVFPVFDGGTCRASRASAGCSGRSSI